MIALLAQSTTSVSLEKGIRCIHILKEFAVGDDVIAEVESMQRLTEIAKGKKNRISSYAKDMLQRIEPLQTERSIRILRGLGITFTSYQAQRRMPGILSGPGIQIGEDYRGTIEQLYYLRHLRFIQDVHLSGEKVNAEMLAQVAEMSHVRLMTIKDAPVDHVMLKSLAPVLPHLNAVHFYYLPLDDRAVPLLTKMTSLARAEFFGLQLSEQSQKKIVQMLPADENIQFRNGGFLGVTGSRGEAECFLNEVHRDGGAFAAGIRNGDQVVRMEGDAVNTFDDLTEHLKNKNVGDSIRTVIFRNGEEIEMNVVLGKWPIRQDY